MTRLPKLNWRVGAAPARPTSTSATDVLALVKSQIQSCMYWSLAETPNTGSNSILIKPLALYSTSSNCHIVIGFGVSGSTAYISPHTNLNSGSRLQAGITPDILGTTGSLGSGSFKDLNADRPFQSATGNPRWSKYVTIASASNVSASYVLESEDNIFIGFKLVGTTSGTAGLFAGAIVESTTEDDGENNKRLYGISTHGATGWATNFWLGAGDTLGNDTSVNSAISFILPVSGGEVTGDTQLAYTTHTTHFSDMTAGAFVSWPNNLEIAIPIGVYSSPTQNMAVPNKHTGIYRGIYASHQASGLTKIDDSSITQLYRIAARMNATSNSIIFAPASGSGL